MNEKDLENDKLEHLLRKAHIPEPSPLLKERITTEARKEWKQTSLELPWQVPVKRLVASAAVAMFVIFIANYFSDLTLAHWWSGSVPITRLQPSDLDVLPEMPYSSFVRHLVLVNRKPSIIDASALRDYTERLQQVLNEMQQNGTSNKQVPNGGRSRLLPVQPHSDYYS